jgi:hypothetical protein
MLSLDPSYPAVWRTATTLQFGAEAVALLDDPQPWQLRVLRELERGIPDGSFVSLSRALGAPSDDDATSLLARIRRALAAGAAPRRTISLHRDAAVDDAQRDLVARGLAAAGFEVDVRHPFDTIDQTARDAAAVVFVVPRVVPPGAAAALMASDVPHLPVVLTGSGAEIGPFVVPGETACLACVAAHRRDADPAWPTVAAQLLGRAVDVTTAVLWESGMVAGRLIDERGHRRLARSRSVVLRSGSLHRDVRMHRPHAECRCRSLAGTATAAAPVRLAPRSATAFARPA